MIMIDLSTVEVGDRVTVIGRQGAKRIEIVTRLTKTQIITKHSRWRRRGGSPIGVEYPTQRIEPTTEAHRAHLKEERLRWRYRKTDPGKLTGDQLTRIVAILDEAKGE